MGNLRRVSSYIMHITDLIAFFVAFFAAYAVRIYLPVGNFYGVPHITLYTPLLLGTVVSYVITVFVLLSDDKFLTRSVEREVAAVARMITLVMLMNVLIMYFTKTSELYSRVYVAVYIVLSFLIDLVFRVIVKVGIMPRYKNSKGAEKVVIVTTVGRIDTQLGRLDADEESGGKDWRFRISGIIFLDEDRKGEYYKGYPVISNAESMKADLMNEEVDSILFDSSEGSEHKKWVNWLQNRGKTVYISLKEFYYNESPRMLDYLGDCAVVSYLPAMPVRGKTLVIKRSLDVVMAICCIPVYLPLAVLTAFFTWIESFGPVHVGRERVGRNGHRFYMYRFRVLRMDAGDRIRANKDPRTLWGRLLCLTHLDGLPEFWNVLVGDMSFVGPEAATVGQFQQNDASFIQNLCTRPGVVGLWSLQKENRDFDRNEYIHSWNLSLDAKILVLMVLRYLGFQSLRRDREEIWTEECERIREFLSEKRPMAYEGDYCQAKSLGRSLYLCIKRGTDIVASLAAILLLSPLLILLTILVIADDGGNPFYGHRRVGYSGRMIRIFKFRSMRQDAGELEKLLTPEQLDQYRREFKIDNDPRITRIGEFLRKSSLDELPQLFNILRGELSIVGPRPIVEKETEIYGSDIAKLLSVKPGLTGYWQAYARNNATYESGERQRMEMYYVDHQSLWLDIRILFQTVISVTRQEGAQ